MFFEVYQTSPTLIPKNSVSAGNIFAAASKEKKHSLVGSPSACWGRLVQLGVRKLAFFPLFFNELPRAFLL